MAVAAPSAPSSELTFEDYLAEGEVTGRYEIIDGVRLFMTNATRLHQRILLLIADLLLDYQRKTGTGETIVAACDVLIRRSPLRTRQPDVLFISNERLAQCGDPADPSPLAVAPELVVEILSPSDRRGVLAKKLKDYCSVGVLECWVVSPEAETVEVLRLTIDGAETVEIYGRDQEIRSVILSDLALPVSAFFVI